MGTCPPSPEPKNHLNTVIKLTVCSKESDLGQDLGGETVLRLQYLENLVSLARVSMSSLNASILPILLRCLRPEHSGTHGPPALVLDCKEGRTGIHAIRYRSDQLA